MKGFIKRNNIGFYLFSIIVYLYFINIEYMSYQVFIDEGYSGSVCKINKLFFKVYRGSNMRIKVCCCDNLGISCKVGQD